MMKQIYLTFYNFWTHEIHYAITFNFAYLNILDYNLKIYSTTRPKDGKYTREIPTKETNLAILV